jgi:hypothetical protein
MNAPWKLICLIFALGCFFFAALAAGPWAMAPAPTYYPWSGRLVALGLFFYMLSLIVS